MIKTVVIDADREDREHIVSLLSAHKDIEVLAHGKDGYDALKLIGSLKPDIAIMDNQLEFIEGEEIPPLLRVRSPFTSVIILARNMSDSQLCRAAFNKVSGLACKETDMDMLPGILKCVSEGGSFISPFLSARVLYLLSGGEPDVFRAPAAGRSAKVNVRGRQRMEAKFPSIDDPAGFLSKTELRILRCLGEGFASNEIASALGLAVGTIRNYISSIMRKMGLQNRSQMVRYACDYGLIHE